MLLGLAVLVICVLGVVWWLGKSRPVRPSVEDSKEKGEAQQLWTSHELDLSEHKWKQLTQRHGVLQTEAIAQVQQIEAKRATEKKRFEEGEALLNVQQDYLGAQQAFQEVAAMNLWLSDDARRELVVAKSLASGADIKKARAGPI